MRAPTELKRFAVHNATRATIVAKDVRLASSYWARLMGLMFRMRLAEGSGILLTKSSSLHGFFMFFRWDAIYIDDEGRVVKIVPAMRPWSVSFGGKGARHAIEVTAGAAARANTEVGDRLTFVPAQVQPAG